MASASPVEVIARGPVACGSVLWRAQGMLRVTVVVKATFGLVDGGVARLVAPVDLVGRDKHRDKDAAQSLEAARDLTPYLTEAGVTLTGHAYAPGGKPVPAMSVRLVVGRERSLLDKTLHVFGDRPGAAPGQITPFVKMPLVFERAAGGPEVPGNPVGVASAGGSRLPNVVNPKDPTRPGSFAPIASVWPIRRGVLGAARQRALRGTVLEIDDDFPWAYFHAAPEDQRTPFLHGDEWITLEGMHPSLARVSTRLPGARAEVRAHVIGPDGASPGQALALVADTLTIDADQQRCSVVFRGHAELPEGEGGLARVRLFAGVALPGYPVAWPTLEEVAAMGMPEIAAEETSPLPLGQTVTSIEASSSPVVPFRPAPPPVQGDLEARTRFLSIDEIEASAGPRSSRVLPFAPTGIGDEGTRTFTREEIEGAASQRATPFEPPPSGVPATRPTIENDASETQMFSAAELAGQAAGRDAAPFPLARPGEGAASPSLPMPGAPWNVARPPSVEHAVEAAPFFHEAAAALDADTTTIDASSPGAGIPPRLSEMPRLILGAPLQAALVPWQLRPPEDVLTVVVKGSFDLVADGPARLREESAFPVGDLHHDDDPERSLAYASDLAIIKLRADVTLVGHAQAPGGSARAMVVQFRFGARGKGFDRTLNVFGDRRWHKSVIALAPTDPESFSSMPLVYERAFGGPSFDQNPLGVGHKAAAGPDGVARLPNVETPGRLVTSPGDAPPVASFAPVPPTWKQRWSKLGTYDKRWFLARWPYFPEDFDAGFFQAAPTAQQLPFLRGDEPFEIVGMTSNRPSLRGTLPSVVARAFVQRTGLAGGGFDEVPLELDTAAFDLDEGVLSLVWRGRVSVSDEDAPEIQHVFVLCEPLAGPRASLGAARAAYLAQVLDKAVVEDSPEAPKVANDAAPAPEPDAEAARLEAELDAASRKADAALRAAGVDPQAPAPPPVSTPEDVAATLRKTGASEAEIAEMLSLLRPAEDAAPPRAPPGLRAEVLRLLAAGESLEGRDLSGGDLGDIDFAGASLAGAVLKDANLQGARLGGATLTGTQLGGADLGEAFLAEADLQGADFTGAKLGGADLSGAKLDDADFTRATGEGAIFRGAKGARAIFANGHWARADFEGAELPAADFTGAALERAVFLRAELSDARFYDAEAALATFDGARMTNARLEGTKLRKASLKEIEAPGSIWERAVLDEANLQGAKLAGAGFLRASCQKTMFTGADLTEARLRRAKCTGALFRKANLMNAVLERADLSLADLRGANLHGAGLWKAQLTDAKIETAILTQSTLARRAP